MGIVFNRGKMFPQHQLDRAQRIIMGLGFGAFIAMYFHVQHAESASIAKISCLTLISPFALMTLLVLAIAVQRHKYFTAAKLAAKNENRALNNTLRELSTKSNYDELTGFPNKRLLEDRFGEAVVRARKNKSLVLLYRVTLTDFSTIVASHGNRVGNEIIRLTAERLGSALRSTDTIVRLGGCNFVLIIESVDCTEDVASVGRKIRKHLGNVFTVEGSLPISASEEVAVAKYPWDGVTVDALMSAAVVVEKEAIAPHWIDAIADKFTDMSQSNFAFLRDSTA